MKGAGKAHPWELAWRSGRWKGTSPPLPAVEEFAGYLRENGARRILDLGAGNGRHSLPLAAGGFDVVALDVSDTALKALDRMAGEAGLRNHAVLWHVMSELPFVDGYFDGVVCTNVLHHGTSKEVRKAFREVGRVVVKGGAGLFVVVSDKDYRLGTGKRLEATTFVFTEGDEKGIVHHFFDAKELRRALEGFEVVKMWEEFRADGDNKRAHLYAVVRKK